MEKKIVASLELIKEITRLEQFKAMNPFSSLAPAIENRIAWLQKLLQEPETEGD